MKRIISFIISILALISSSKTPEEKAMHAIENYMERMGYECEIVSIEWCGDVNCSYFDPAYQRLREKSDKYFKAYLFADFKSEKIENKRLYDEVSTEMAKLRIDWGKEQYNYYSCIVKCVDYKMKKDLESLYYFISPDYKTVCHTADQLNW